MTHGAGLTVMIVDDEPIARRRLARLLRRLDDLSVVGEAGNVHEAVEAAAQLTPDVILMDIQMPGGDGFSALGKLGQTAPVVIFVTAHDRYALRAFDVDAVDYITKPVELSRLAMAIERARDAVAALDSRERIHELHRTVHTLRDALSQAQPSAHTIWAKSRTEFRNIEIESISHIQAERDYVRIHAGEKSHLHNDTLSAMAERLTGMGFLRVHRSYLVRRRKIVGILRAAGGRLNLKLADGSMIPVGKRHAAKVAVELGIEASGGFDADQRRVSDDMPERPSLSIC